MRKILLLIAVVALTVCCNRKPAEPTHDELVMQIDTIESPLMKSAMLESVDTVKGNKLVELYIKFADKYPSDSLAAPYLHRAAQVCNGMDRIDDMVSLYDRVIDNYPEYIHLDECYYEKGIALDNAGRKDEARIAYQEFLDEFPNHFLADDIRKAIPLLDMSDELLMEFLNSEN